MIYRLFSPTVLLTLTLLTFSCKTTLVRFPSHPKQASNQSLPPGQAKKVYGHKSAKAFAPGQRKKQGNTIIIVNNEENHGKKKGKKK